MTPIAGWERSPRRQCGGWVDKQVFLLDLHDYRRSVMTSLDNASTTLISRKPPGRSFDEEQMAAASFLARYSGRTLEAYRHDLRGFFQWAHDHEGEVKSATRPQIELFRVSMEQRGLAAAIIDRRLSTVCGFYRFAPIDGIITSSRAQYVRRSQVHPTEPRGLDRSEFGMFLFTAERFDRDHAALAGLLGVNGLRVTEACETNVEDLGFERWHRTLRIPEKGGKPATIPLVPRTALAIDLAAGERCEGPILRRRHAAYIVVAFVASGCTPTSHRTHRHGSFC
jgi:integrase/recombinase XerD